MNNGGTLFICGNSGSASDSQHFAAELIGRFSLNRRPLRAVALTSDTSVLSCIANDFSFQSIFSRQVAGLAKPNDVLLGISTSGNSENIVDALKVAQSMNVSTIALLGKDGGRAIDYADYSIVIPSTSVARIQETHIIIIHILCDLLELNLGLKNP